MRYPKKRGVTKRPFSSRKEKPVRAKGTSWGHVAEWYHEHIESGDTYHEQVIKPNLMRLVGDVKGKKVLDIGCGEGYFSRALAETGASVTGVDIARELIAIAKKQGPNSIAYVVAPAEHMPLPDNAFDTAVCVLALQNIANVSAAMAEVSRVLKSQGNFIVVLNHPAFRIPRLTQWGFDNEANVQFRRVDGYLSESHTDIRMHPGSDPSAATLSYHRPLQLYMKELAKHGFVLAGLEEWISHRKSEKGPRAEAEDRARKEFPLFLMLKARKQ